MSLTSGKSLNLLSAIIVVLALTLHGCGSDDSESSSSSETTASGGCQVNVAQACITTYQTDIQAANMDTAGTCTAVGTMLTCIGNAGCCTNSATKTSMDAIVNGMNSVCTGANGITATCS